MAGNGGSGGVEVTPDDVGPVIAIITWFFMIMMILAVIFRVLIKLFVRRQLNFDDYIICGALVFGVAQCIVISFSIQDGLGKRKANLAEHQLAGVQHTLYAADLLFVLACGLAKVSLLMLLQHLAVSNTQLAITKASICLVVAWTVSAFFTLAFQCGLPHPWNVENGHCLNQFAFWAVMGSFDILTEIAVIGLPIVIMLPVQIAISKKLTVIFCFLFRICVVVAILMRLYYLYSYHAGSDFVFDSKASQMMTQILLSATITTACIPYLKPFLDSFDSGALGIQLGQSARATGSNTYEMSNIKSSGMRSRTRGVDLTVSSTISAADGDVRPDGTAYLVAISGHHSRRQQSEDSLNSENSNAMIIKRTDQWEVHYDHEDQLAGSSRSKAIEHGTAYTGIVEAKPGEL